MGPVGKLPNVSRCCSPVMSNSADPCVGSRPERVGRAVPEAACRAAGDPQQVDHGLDAAISRLPLSIDCGSLKTTLSPVRDISSTWLFSPAFPGTLIVTF